MTVNKHLKLIAYLALGALICWAAFKYALPWLAPFILAFLISRMIDPAVRFLTARLRIRRSFASAVCTMLTFAALVTLLALAIGRIVYELTAFAKDLPTLLSDLTRLFTAFREKVNVYIMTAPDELQGYLRGTLDGVTGKSADVLAALSGRIITFLSSIASLSPKVILFIFTCAVSTFFISSGYNEITAFLLRQIPERRHKAMRDFKGGLITALGKWVKAELMLSGVTFLQLIVAFLIMRIEFAVLLALLIAVIDVLPVIGAGTILAPWAVISLISGDTSRAVMLIVTFGITSIVRNILEPKLIGGQIGLPPIATMLAMYVGFCTTGVIGMALFPIALIMIKHLNDKGYIKLWK